MSNEEHLIKLNLMEQRMQKIQEQLMIIEQQSAEINALSSSLDKIRGKKDEEILAHIGKGIFLRSKIMNNDELIIDVGSKVFLKKSIDEGRRIVERQAQELANAKSFFLNELAKAKAGAEEIILEIERNRIKIKDKEK